MVIIQYILIGFVFFVFFRKPTRPSFIDKAGCTQQFESELSLRSFAQLFPVKGGATSLLCLLQWSLRTLRFPLLGTETVLKPLRYKVGGASEVYARRGVRDGTALPRVG